MGCIGSKAYGVTARGSSIRGGLAKRALAFALVLAVALTTALVCAPARALAAEGEAGSQSSAAAGASNAAENLDLSARGSISVTLESTDGNPLGGELSLYKVADVVADGTGWHFQWLAPYADVDDGLYNATGQLSQAYSSELATKLDALVTGAGDAQASVGADGTARFSNVGVGLYLVKQTTAADGYDAVDSFVVSVPMQDEATGALKYDVDASPKAGAVSPTPTPEEPSGPETPQVPTGTLPQTGQLWWPVAVLGAVGVVLIALGVARSRRGRTGAARARDLRG